MNPDQHGLMTSGFLLSGGFANELIWRYHKARAQWVYFKKPSG